MDSFNSIEEFDDTPILFTRDSQNDKDVAKPVIIDGIYKISYNVHPLIKFLDESFTVTKIHWIILLFTLLISASVSIFGSLPYIAYEGFLSNISWGLFCVGRACIYGGIFTVAWIDICTNLYKLVFAEKKVYGNLITLSIYRIIRWIFGSIFALLYTFLYSIKWFNLGDLYFKYAVIPIFSLSWFVVFWKLIDKQLSSSISTSGSISSSLNNRRRRILLFSIKRVEQICYESNKYSQILYQKISQNKGSFSLMFARLTDAQFYTPEREEILTLYDEKGFDRWSELRSNIMNVILGVSLVVTTLSMIEDYGHSIYVTFSIDETVYLWLVTVFCSILACMYLIATYSIHHKFVRFNMIWNRYLPLKFLCRLPIMFCGGLIASIRMNSSYSIFGKIAGKFGMPYSIGMTFIWCCTIMVFLIDYGASVKIVSYSIKKFFTMICMCVDTPFLANIHVYRCFVIRYYTKRTKWLVRNCHEGELDELCKALLI